MYTPLHCIALRTVKYSDRYSILSAYSLEKGRVSLLVPAGKGRASARYRALTMPMGLFDCVARIEPKKEIYHFSDIGIDMEQAQGEMSHPVKNALAFFLADFFGCILREPVPENAMYELVRRSAILISTNPVSRLPNLHIAAIMHTIRIMGIEPDTATWQPGYIFDMANGVWHRDLTLFTDSCLTLEESEIARTVSRINFSNHHLFLFNRDQRNILLGKMLKYLSIHGFGKMELASLEILKEVF